MEDLQIFDTFAINSKIRETYKVSFINDFDSLKSLVEKGKLVAVIDKKIAKLFPALSEILSSSRKVEIECNEQNKTIDYCQEVIRRLIEQNTRKDDTLIAIGGGITQDIVAFVSSILYRGVDWKFYPTTLLAQCDSCIGSKSSINFDQFKNLIGTFNPPSQIFINPLFLDTLSESEIRSGIGEMLHYFFTEGIDIADQISEQYESLLHDRSRLLYFIKNSLRIKKQVIEIDEFDTGYRHIFNYGHTFGHAIETITEYQIPHGQAVSIGMDIANYISLKLGMQEMESFQRCHTILRKNIPPFSLNQNNINEYLSALSRDKKNKDNRLGCILSKGPGKVEKMFLPMDDVLKQYLLDYSKEYTRSV
ncbi:3-dehydroquinate synthase [Hydrobacter penzbergensis]|uniref:3-dehydroquinate synthase n=1 Tax=Hydrobacter penzbergensis TaxID=1235997 RepID=A0A8X8LBC6_9BACT|nr:AroB-related putative sugar phosphate phospholyase (cyclizing) [Hydrobacter penzbergensis]SDW85873.1 3-dehydroquinate synthase [Hydrobacter penzbergensis]